MIRAVLFDFFGVIFSYTYWDVVGGHDQNIAKYSGIRDKVNIGRMEWPDFIQQLSKIMDKPVEEINQLYRAESLDPKMVHYIHELHKTHKVALVTNASDYFIQGMLDRSHIRKLFDQVVVSSRLGYAKPDSRMLSYALDKLGVVPAEAVMVDDSPDNIQSAISLGMHGVLYENFDKFVEDMASKLKH